MMKRFFGVMIGVLLMAGTLYAADGDLKVTGSLGVGLPSGANPMYLLDVGNSNAGSNGVNTIRLSGRNANANGTFASFRLSNSSDTGGSYFGIVARRESNNYGVSADLTINNTGAGATPLTAMTLQYNGNVGIGTTNPGARLDILGTDTSPITSGMQVTTPTYPQYIFNATSGASNAKIWRIIGRGTNDFQIQTGPVKHFV